MPTFILSWNPKKWQFTNHFDEVARTGYVDEPWSCGPTRRIRPNDRLFILKLGVYPKGIVGSGYSLSAPYEVPDPDDSSSTIWMINARIEVLLDPEKELLDRSRPSGLSLDRVNWSPRASGMSLTDDATDELETIWKKHIEDIGRTPEKAMDEVIDSGGYWEGAVRRITVNAYERNNEARIACIAHYGARCCVCDLDLQEAYGDIARGYIHVHHLRQLSEIRKGYVVDPIRDLMPVCPNCHSVIHMKSPPYTIQEVKEIRRLTKH